MYLKSNHSLESHPPSIALLSNIKVFIEVIPLINYLITRVYSS
jgi:hypothetical protein